MHEPWLFVYLITTRSRRSSRFCPTWVSNFRLTGEYQAGGGLHPNPRSVRHKYLRWCIGWTTKWLPVIKKSRYFCLGYPIADDAAHQSDPDCNHKFSKLIPEPGSVEAQAREVVGHVMGDACYRSHVSMCCAVPSKR